jgi:hypothetical protein
MDKQKKNVLESMQKTIAKLIATNPAGHGLCLIGGLRFRLLDSSVRLSMDIDYHWDGDPDKKQTELIRIFKGKLMPLIKRQFGYQANVLAASGPEAESPMVRIVNLAFWLPGTEYSRIEIPVEITRISCKDAHTVRTADGTIYPTPSDLDVIESKIISVFNRTVLQHRDLVDIFLFSNQLAQESPARLKDKFTSIQLKYSAIVKRLNDLETNAVYHTRAIQSVIAGQVDPDAAANLQSGGGAELVYHSVLKTIQIQVKPYLEENA